MRSPHPARSCLSESVVPQQTTGCHSPRGRGFRSPRCSKGLYIDDFIRMAESGMSGSRSLTPSCLPMHSRKRAGVPCFLESSALKKRMTLVSRSRANRQACASNQSGHSLITWPTADRGHCPLSVRVSNSPVRRSSGAKAGNRESR
jgi:hypothetical protein